MNAARLILPAAMLLAGLGLVSQAAPAAGPAQSGAALFMRCAACHTATGAGVPGAYPPLGADFRKLATKPAGRRYLALAVIRGLNGPITVGGKPYRGMMPAQAGMDDAAVAAVLNHVGTAIAKTGPAFAPFNAAEVAGIRAGGASLSAADVARLHAGAGGG